MTLLKTAERAIAEYDMIPPGAAVIAAVSGGADSVALLHVLHGLSCGLDFNLYAAHFNHRLRGEESDGDEAFVREMCAGLGVPLYVGSGDVSGEAERRKTGLEETARDMRYAFFRDVSEKLGGALVATAHTADDNLETILFRIARGTGTRGLCGIPPVRGNVIRPLLCATRQEVEEYLHEQGLSHREDSSNGSDDYARNLIRHRAVPALREINPAAARKAGDMARILRADDEYLDSLAASWEITAENVASAPYPIASRLVRRLCGGGLSAQDVEAVIALCRSESPSGSLDLPGVTVRREYGALLTGKPERLSFAPAAISPGETVILPEAGLRVTCEAVDYAPEIHKSFTVLLFKRQNICGNMTLRPRKEGDTIRLSPRSGTKSLKKLFIERKIPVSRRSLIPVVEDEAGVIGVFGIGTDARTRFKAGDSVIKITFEEIQ